MPRRRYPVRRRRVRRKATSRKGYRKKASKKRRTTRGSGNRYSTLVNPRPMQVYNRIGATAVRKFTYSAMYTVDGVTLDSVAQNSILAIPVQDLGIPIPSANGGIWNAATGSQLVTGVGYTSMYQKYDKYVVVGAKVEVRITCAAVGESAQHNRCFLVRTSTTGQIATNTEPAFFHNMNGAIAGNSYNNGTEIGCRLSMTHSPARVHGVSKGALNAIDDIACLAGAVPGQAAARQFINIVIVPERSGTNHDMQRIQVKVSYIVRFSIRARGQQAGQYTEGTPWQHWFGGGDF